jgi:hypothetical protein
LAAGLGHLIFIFPMKLQLYHRLLARPKGLRLRGADVVGTGCPLQYGPLCPQVWAA